MAAALPAILVLQALDTPSGTRVAEGFRFLAVGAFHAFDADTRGYRANGAAASHAIRLVEAGRDAGMIFEAAALTRIAVSRGEALNAPLVFAERSLVGAVGRGIAPPGALGIVGLVAVSARVSSFRRRSEQG